MSDFDKILVAAGLAIVGGAVLGILKWSASRVVKHVDDQPRIEARLSCASDINIINRIGCPCVVVRLVGVSERPTRITAVEVSLEVDKAFVAALEPAFGVPFTQGISEGLPPPRFRVDLVPVIASADSVVIIGRDDIAEFLLPVPFTPFEHFLRAPSQAVEVAIRAVDGQRRVLLRGLEIQEMIRFVADMQGGQLRAPHVTLTMGITISSKSPAPHLAIVGKTNSGPIEFPPLGQGN